MFNEILICTYDRWHDVWGDPILPATVHMTAYAITAWLTFRVVSLETGREKVLWVLVTALLVFLFANTHLDFHSLPRAFGRCIATAQGWYAQRSTVKTILLIIIAGVVALSLIFTLVVFYREVFLKSPVSKLLLAFGFPLTLAYQVVQGAGFHRFDAFGAIQIGFLNVSDLTTLIGTLLVALAAVSKLKDLKRDP